MRNWIDLIESYAPEAFFWFDANKNEIHMFGDQDDDHSMYVSRVFGEQPVSRKDDSDEDYWVWNSAQIDHAIKNNWVRGRYSDTRQALSLQGNRRSIHKAARWFVDRYSVEVLFIDFGEGEESFFDLNERKSISLRGERLEYFLKRGSVPSAMVMEGEDDGIFYHGTTSPIETFYPLTHFGTRKAAENRLKDRGGDGQIIAVALDIHNPLRVTDAEASDEASMCNAIARGDYPQLDISIARNDGVAAALEQAGYDGMVYQNRLEDRGRDSFVILHSEQATKVS